MGQTDRQTDGHGNSMTNSAQRGRVGENVYSLMWMIRRLKALDATRHHLLNVFQKVLSVLTLRVPILDCLLRTDLSRDRVLKTGLHIIWGADYTTFKEMLLRYNLRISKLLVKTQLEV